MKTVYLTTLIICAFLMLIFPLCAKDNLEKTPVSTFHEEEIIDSFSQEETVKLKLSSDNSIIEIPISDYIFGVVAAEMPALYESEALKAQAVAAYTFYLVRRERNTDEPFDISDDYSVDQAYVSIESARTKWADGADEYENKIRSAIAEVLGQKVLFNGKPATTLYHAISYGVTENASEVWDGEYPYLVSVDSNFDKLEKNYLVEKTFTSDELIKLLSLSVETIDANQNCFSNIVRTSAGGVKNLTVAGKEISGSTVRQALSLRSANFDITFNDQTYTFTTKGYGHSIGMSQYGAHYMAMQGKNYKEILLHYYTGCTIE